MGKFYFELVVAGRRTCNPENTAVVQVPAKHRDEVLELLKANGRDADGNKIP